MAEIKNSFLKSKMNKDLDDRLIPNGEYRDAQNISVGKSEDDDIGALENVLGNALVTASQLLTFNDLVISVAGGGGSATVNGNIAAEVGMTLEGTGYDAVTLVPFPFITVVTSVTYDAGLDRTTLGTAYTFYNIKQGDTVDVFFPLEAIGHYTDKPNNRIIVFLTAKDANKQYPPNITNYFDPNTTEAQNYIVSYTPNATPSPFQTIAKGAFLNFSVKWPMTGVTMIENLLYFTDNFNQPRQLNVATGIGDPTYYSNEDHISVAKYAPYLPVDLVRESTGALTAFTGTGITGDPYILTFLTSNLSNSITVGMQVVSRLANDTPQTRGDDFIYVTATQILDFNTLVGGTGYTAGINIATTGGTGTGLTVTTTVVAGVITAVTITSPGSGYTSGDVITIFRTGTPDATITLTSLNSTVTLSPATAQTTAIPVPIVTDKYRFIVSTMTNESDDGSWPGDPDFLEDKFVRFSYRFKYADNEYSIMAPFSQIGFVPMQKGYFFNGDEDDAYQSTIVSWMENFIQQVQLLIPLPTSTSLILNDYKISEIDILYKESDALAVKVIETIDVSTFGGVITTDNTKPIFTGDGVFLPDNILVYTYQSRKPYKTLPQAQTVRVYDKVPVRALAQESAGNRIMYGNYFDKHTPPASIDYNVAFTEKDSNLRNNWVEYPNHSVKQNRNYQVGFILADRYGRQSPVILSSVNATDANGYVGSTVYAPYEDNAFDVKGWFGKGLQVIVNNQINPLKEGIAGGVSGSPGLYNSTLGTDYNPLGWYSYKIVVRQQEQDYYNVYLPGILDGYPLQISTVPVTGVSSGIYQINEGSVTLSSLPANLSIGMVIQRADGIEVGSIISINVAPSSAAVLTVTPLTGSIFSGETLTFSNSNIFIPFPTGEEGKTANIVLFNDNINKVPRDLAEVGPQQKQFRSSVQLFGRVQNQISGSPGVTYNKQFYGIGPDFARASHTVIAIGEAKDLNIIYSDLASTGGKENFYQIDTNPLVGRISTPTPIGVISTTSVNTNMTPFLAVYETEPQESILDLFWETTTAGLISELNTAVAVDNDSPVYFSDTDYSQFENQLAEGISGTNDATVVPVGGLTITLTLADPLLTTGMEIYIGTDRVGNISSIAGAVLSISSALIEITAGETLTFYSSAAGNKYSRYVTDWFWPKSAGGLNILTATVLMGDGSVESNSGIDQMPAGAHRFGIYGPGVSSVDGPTNDGGFRLYIKRNEFNFVNTSLLAGTPPVASGARDRYTFNITVDINQTGVAAVSLPTTGSLSNIAPIVTNAAMSATTIAPTIGTVPAVNGSSYAGAPDQEGRKFEFDTNGGTLGAVPTGLDGQPGFIMLSPYNGEITQTTQNNNVGVYNVGIKVSDAVNTADGSTTSASLYTYIEQEISIGADPVNVLALTITPCVNDVPPSDSFNDTKAKRACVANGLMSDPAIYEGVWYIGADVLQDLAVNYLPPGVVPIMQDGLGNTIPSASGYEAYRLGSAAHETGTIAFLLNSRLNLYGAFPAATVMAQLTWKVWSRPVPPVGPPPSNLGWSIAADINRSDLGSGVGVEFIRSNYGGGAVQGDTMYNQVVLAFERGTGAADLEWCIAAQNMSNVATDISGGSTEKLVAWVQSTDLNFPGCVVDNGTTIVSLYNAATYYGYGKSGPNLQTNCTLINSTSLYSSIPYGEYVDQLFTNTGRNAAWSPVNFDATPDAYYTWNIHTAGVVSPVSSLTAPFPSFSTSGRFNDTLGSVYRGSSGPSVVYTCWTLSPGITAPQRKGKS